MGYTPSFDVGDIVTNEQMRSEFKIGNMGGMCKSNTYNCLVLISDHSKGLYEDKWYGDELHYTGMGQRGDQVLKGNQNGTLNDSNTNGVEVHLFEVMEPGEYTYRGVVKLSSKPYQEEQKDVDGHLRKVWMFPITPISGAPVVSEDDFEAAQKKKEAKAKSMSLAALASAAKGNSTKKPGTRKVNSTQIVRDPFISEYVKRLAGGKCELCRQPAPFKDSSGNPYLESHHIKWLSKGGADSVDNSVALCPNCHKKMHIVNDPADVKVLEAIAKSNAT